MTTVHERSATTSPEVRRIWTFAVLGGLAQSLAGAAGSLLAHELGGTDIVAGLPATMLTLGAGGAAVALSWVTQRHERRSALRLGSAAAAVGCAIVVFGGMAGLVAGSLLIGAGSAAVMLSRYAARELRPGVSGARSIASVMVMITVGAVVGPNLLAPSTAVGHAFGAPMLGGPYVVAGLVFAVAAVLLRPGAPISVRSPMTGTDPAVLTGTTSPGPPRQEPNGHAGRTAMAAMGVANLVMVAVMTMAPLRLAHAGTGLDVIGLVVSAHIAAMFAPAVLSGRLTERLGAQPALVVSMAVLVAACGCAAAAGTDPVALGAAMVVLGVGWNLSVVAGSDLLASGARPEERPRREGWGELAMGIGAALGGILSGVVMALTSYPALSLSAALLPAGVMVSMLVARLAGDRVVAV
jgi:MFS family permease